MATISIVIALESAEFAIPLTISDSDAQRLIAARCAMYSIADPQQAITELANRMLQQVFTETVQYERGLAVAAAIAEAESSVQDIEVVH